VGGRDPQQPLLVQLGVAILGGQDQVYAGLGNREESVSKPSDLVQGSLDLLLLNILALRPLHGWAISQRLKQVSGEVLRASDGSLYPALHKLEQQGWITAEWKPTENFSRAKFYSLTGLGRDLRCGLPRGGLRMSWEHWIHTLALRLRTLFRRRQVEQELDDEFQYHLESQIEEILAAGMSPEE